MAKTFVYIQGLTHEAGHWGNFLNEMQLAFPTAKHLCIDMPGCGVHYQKKSPRSIPKIVDHMRNDLLELDPEGTERYLLGISLGGMISADWLTRYPEDFKLGGLLNTSFNGFSPMFNRLRPYSIGTMLRTPFMKDFKDRERLILQMISNDESLYDEMAERWKAICEERPVSLNTFLNQLFAAATYRPSKTKPNTPVVIFSGAGDRMVSPKCSHDISNQWGVPHIIHPTAGHALMLDASEWFIQEFKGLVS